MEETVCDTVVSRYGEEMQFAQKRANSFCGTLATPSQIDFVWRVGSPGINCASTCAQVEGGQSECSARAIVAVNNDADLDFVKSAFAKAGVICTSVSAGDTGVTGTPAYRGDHCITTGGSYESGLSYCMRTIAAPYQRLCACTN